MKITGLAWSHSLCGVPLKQRKKSGHEGKEGEVDHAVIEKVMPRTIGHALCEWMETVLKEKSICTGHLKFAFIISCTFLSSSQYILAIVSVCARPVKQRRQQRGQ